MMFSSRGFALLILSLAACDVRLSLGTPGGKDTSASAPSTGAPSGTAKPGEWEWVSPRTGAATMRAIAGTSARDLWIAGDAGSIVHFDGTTTTLSFKGEPADSFYALAAAPNDVWAAGEGNGVSGSRVAHFDGHTWSTDWSLASQHVHAFWTRHAGDTFALTDIGGSARLQHWDGTAWKEGCMEPDHKNAWFPVGQYAHDMFGFSDSDIWIVGDGGYIGHYDAVSCVQPVQDPVKAAADSAFAPTLNYLSVWGANPRDVWAMFVDKTKVGFSHFDGTSWKVAQRDVATLSSALPSGPTHAGRLIGAGAGGSVLAIVPFPSPGGSASMDLVFNGTKWEMKYDAYANDPSSDVTRKGGLWTDATGHTFAAADFGGLLSFDGLGASGYYTAWSPVGPRTLRRQLMAIAPIRDDLAFGIAPYSINTSSAIARFDGSAWAFEAPLTIDDVRGKPTAPTYRQISALAANDVWAVGSVVLDPNGAYGGVIAHYDGTRWSAMVPAGSTDMTGVWALSANDVWAVGVGAPIDWTMTSLVVWHWDGHGWSSIKVPDWALATSDKNGGTDTAAVFGIASDKVWITGNQIGSENDNGSPASPRGYVLRWNGTGFDTLLHTGDNDRTWTLDRTTPRAWASSENDLWLPTSPSQHWDGRTWTKPNQGTDHPVFEMTGTAADDVWQVGAGERGGAIRHTDGKTFTTVLETSAHLYTIAKAPDGTIWAGGEGGSTLRYKPATVLK